MAAVSRQHERLVERTPFYYGWVIWAVAAVGLIATAPGQAFTLSLFIDQFIVDFNLTRSTVAGVFSLGTFGASLALTWIGQRIDQYGNRTVGMIAVGAFSIVVIAMSQVNSVWMLLIGFFLLRLLGQGAIFLNSSTVLARWFARRRGRMMSLALVIFALFQVVYVPWLGEYLTHNDWRDTFILLGVGVAIMTLPLFWLFLQNEPQDFGLYTDGQRMTREELTREFAPENNWTLREARRTPIFWIFLMGRIASPAIGSALIFHQVSIFAEHGYSASYAAATFGRVALIAAGMSLVYGYLIDHIRPGRVMTLHISAAVVSSIFAMTMSEQWMTYAFAIAFGFVIGGGAVFDGAAWANVFGRQYVGEITGFVRMMLIIGTSLGPIILGVSYDYLGGYTPAFLLMIGYACIPLVGSFLMTRPNPCHKIADCG